MQLPYSVHACFNFPSAVNNGHHLLSDLAHGFQAAAIDLSLVPPTDQAFWVSIMGLYWGCSYEAGGTAVLRTRKKGTQSRVLERANYVGEDYLAHFLPE